MKQYVDIGKWEIDAQVDDDGHLTIGINNKDGTRVGPLGVDIATNDEEWVERFTTDGIEKAYNKDTEGQDETATT